jgi:RND superfamily putative drug exporter
VSRILAGVARFSARHRVITLVAWLLVAVASIGIAQVSGGQTNDSFTIPGTEAQRAADLLQQKFPSVSGASTQVVFVAPKGTRVTSPAQQAAILQTVGNLNHVPQVEGATDPFQALTISRDGSVALSQVQYRGQAQDVKDGTLSALQQATRPARDAGLRVEFGGSVYPGWRVVVSETPELIGMGIAFLILLVALGAAIPALLPILGAVVGVTITLEGINAAASLVSIASVSTTVALMLGLSCGIDYGLFIVSRHRTNLMLGVPVEESIGLAAGTAGGAVVFAGSTVIVSLLGLLVPGIPFLGVMGVAAACSVLVALLIALTLLPALLGFAGKRVVSFLPPAPLRRRIARVTDLAARHPERTLGAAWQGFVVRFRWPVLAAGVGLLLLLAAPALQMHLGLPTSASDPPSATDRQAYDTVSSAFGPGFNGPLLVVADGIRDPAQIQPMVATLQHLKDVRVAEPVGYQNGVAVIEVVPKTGPASQATTDLVNRIRDHRTEVAGGSGARILVGGVTAAAIDVTSRLSQAVPVFLALVVSLALILLTFAFRTILVPIKSILGFLLSIAAALGLQVAIFQWGWGASLLGVTRAETISFLPIIMLAIIFGLSSDYELFVASRVKEQFTRDGDARRAVRVGAGQSVRVVMSAALIMFSIFVAFMVTDNPFIRVVGFSFAAGVFIDAFVVRLTLVPAVLAIGGRRMWWHPRWFARWVPDPDIEGKRLEERPPARVEETLEEAG